MELDYESFTELGYGCALGYRDLYGDDRAMGVFRCREYTPRAELSATELAQERLASRERYARMDETRRAEVLSRLRDQRKHHRESMTHEERDSALARRRRRDKAWRERRREQGVKPTEEQRVRAAKKAREWVQNNRERRRAAQREWTRANRERARAYDRKSKAKRKKGSES